MTKNEKTAIAVALLIWWFWPSPVEANTTDVSIRTDPEFYPEGSWRDFVFF